MTMTPMMIFLWSPGHLLPVLLYLRKDISERFRSLQNCIRCWKISVLGFAHDKNISAGITGVLRISGYLGCRNAEISHRFCGLQNLAVFLWNAVICAKIIILSRNV